MKDPPRPFSGKELVVYWRGCVKELLTLSQEPQQNCLPQFHLIIFSHDVFAVMDNVRSYCLLLPCDEIYILHCCKIIMTSVAETSVDDGCVCV